MNLLCGLEVDRPMVTMVRVVFHHSVWSITLFIGFVLHRQCLVHQHVYSVNRLVPFLLWCTIIWLECIFLVILKYQLRRNSSTTFTQFEFFLEGYEVSKVCSNSVNLKVGTFQISFPLPRDIWQCLETMLVVKTRSEGVLVGPSGQKLEMQLNIPQCTEQPHNKDRPAQYV